MIDGYLGLSLFLLFCSTCVLVGEIRQPSQDPFLMPPRANTQTTIILEGIMDNAGTQCVALGCGADHDVVATGGLFHGFTVTKITSTEVELKNGSDTRILKVD